MSSNSSKMESVGVKKRKKLRPNPNQHSLLKTKSLIRKKKNKSIKPRTNKPSQASQKHFSFHLPYGSEAMLNIQRVKVNQELLGKVNHCKLVLFFVINFSIKKKINYSSKL